MASSNEPPNNETHDSINLRGICSTCGKPIRKLRKGSFTSWIFRASSCTCEVTAAPALELNDSIDAPSEAQLDYADLPVLGNQYESIELIGQGGMGRVYKAHDSDLDRTVAIKVLKQELSIDKAANKRFQQEVKSAKMLSHPNLASIYDYGIDSKGSPYIVMEYINGQGLDEVLDFEYPIDIERTRDIFSQICKAMSYIHEKGVIHRDLKPSNVILATLESGFEQVRIVDFGIAKVAESGELRTTQGLTQTGEVFGSPAYMSPEQCLGVALDERSDIYSFGCLMYEVINGAPPFKGENPIQIIVQHLNAPPDQLPTRDIPVELKDIILLCLQKDPDDRLNSFKDLLDLLNGLPKVLSQARQLTVNQTLATVFGALTLTWYSFQYFRSVMLPDLKWNFFLSIALSGLAYLLWHKRSKLVAGKRFNRKNRNKIRDLKIILAGASSLLCIAWALYFFIAIPNSYFHIESVTAILDTLAKLCFGLGVAGFAGLLLFASGVVVYIVTDVWKNESV